nr:reverse transcriptase domain, reverse transcriptase zinc-binding domain protein [Tanacetum cinerariifolium]
MLLRNLNWLRGWFQVSLKARPIFCNVLPHVKNAILSIMPFAEGDLPVKYLGVPLISSRLLNRDCKILVEQATNRIGDLKNKSLSFAGRLQLCKSVISSMHVYWASILMIHQGIIDDIHKLIRGFLWCNGEFIRGKAKVSWEVICLPKNMDNVPLSMHQIFLYLKPMGNKRTARTFKNIRRSTKEIRDIIMVTVRLKLITFRFEVCGMSQTSLGKFKLCLRPKGVVVVTKLKLRKGKESLRGTEQSHLVSTDHLPDPYDPKIHRQLSDTGLPISQHVEGTWTSSLLPEEKASVLSDSKIITQLNDEGTNQTLIDQSGAGFDQVDKTQSTGLEESVPNLNKGNTSSEVELDIIPHVLNLGQIHDLFYDLEEEFPSFNIEEFFVVGDEMETDKP